MGSRTGRVATQRSQHLPSLPQLTGGMDKTPLTVFQECHGRSGSKMWRSICETNFFRYQVSGFHSLLVLKTSNAALISQLPVWRRHVGKKKITTKCLWTEKQEGAFDSWADEHETRSSAYKRNCSGRNGDCFWRFIPSKTLARLPTTIFQGPIPLNLLLTTCGNLWTWLVSCLHYHVGAMQCNHFYLWLWWVQNKVKHICRGPRLLANWAAENAFPLREDCGWKAIDWFNEVKGELMFQALTPLNDLQWLHQVDARK